MSLATLYHDAKEAMPVFLYEYRTRMRRPWLYWMALWYVPVVSASGVAFLYHFAQVPAGEEAGGLLGMYRQVGVTFALLLFALQLVLVAIIGPSLTAGSFARERANRTMFFTWLTPLSSAAILDGKRLYALLAVLMLLVVTMPLCAVSALFGGIDLLDLAAGYAMVGVYAHLIIAGGLYLSARCAHPVQAAVYTYLGLLATPLLCPFLLLPYAGLAAFFLGHDLTIAMPILRALPFPVLALPGIVTCALVARFLRQETLLLLDHERQMLGDPPDLAVPAPVSDLPAALPTPRAGRRW